MIERVAMMVLVVAAASAIPAHGQRKPDFSGVWVVAGDPGATGIGGPSTGPLGSGWGRKFVIRQDEATLELEWAIFARGDLQPPLRFRFALDGSEVVNAVGMGRGRQDLRSRVTRNGDRLVIATVSWFENPDRGQPIASRVVRTLRLQPAPLPQIPSSLVIETVREGVAGVPPSSTRTVYVQSP